MPGPENLLFAGTTTAPARDFVAEQLVGAERILLPCVGRWAVATAVATRTSPERIEASDLCLFSTLIGYMADPRHDLDELGITVPERYAPLVAGAEDAEAWAAGVMLALKLASLPPKNVHTAQLRSELWGRREQHRAHVAEGLREQVKLLKGCRYDVADCREVVRSLIDVDQPELARTALFVNPPGYKGGYTKMYGQAEALLWPGGTQLAAGEFDPSEALPMLAEVTDSPALAAAYIHHGDEAMPAGWTKLAAFCGKHNRTDYVIANHDTSKRLVSGRFDKGPVRWPVWTDDSEITLESEISFTFVDKWTCLHYRDLFVHRLGITEAEQYGLMLIDGKVVTSFGLHCRDLRLGRRDFAFESFGITVTSSRYARLGKLFMLLLTTTDFRNWLIGQSHAHQSHVPIGIMTASPTQHHEGKTDRSVLKLVDRVALPGGGFHLVYGALWREETWGQVLERWLRRWGHIHRPDWAERPVETV